MQCTPEQIELKRRQAQLKLEQKKQTGQNPNLQPSSPLLQRNFSSSNLQNASPGFSRHNSLVRHNSYSSPLKHSNIKPYDKPKLTVPFGSNGRNDVISGSCYLVSEDRFCVDINAYCAPAIEIFKTIPSKSYNPKTRKWDFHINDYEMVQEKFQVLQPEVVIGKLPKYVISCCKMPTPNYGSIDLNKIDPELLSALMPFQEEGVCFGIDKNGRCLIGDDMGLGKTFQALAIAHYYSKDWPLLIATTASMKNTWEETIHKYLPSVSIMETQYMISGKDYIGDSKILIVSHDLMSRCVEKLMSRNFGVLIIDESHTLKNFKAKCTKAAISLANKAKRVVLLSGTPALSRPSELYTQLSLIDDKFFGNFFEYSKRYCDGKTTTFGWDASGTSNLQELEVILAKKFMIRRTKDEVLKSLPNRTREVVKLDVNLAQFSEEDRVSLKALAAKYMNSKKKSEHHAALLSFFSETSKIKIPSVCSYILQILDSTKKFLVFAHHQKMLDAIEKVLRKKDKLFIRIDGSTTMDQRKYFVDKFQYDDNYVCAILSITAANAGITLTAAQLVLFAELHWNPSILSQAESRAHRIGQEGQVVVKYLLAPGTADDSIWPLLQGKQDILKKIGLSTDSFGDVSVTKQDITNKEPIAECLHSNVTFANTFDISMYFKSPEKKDEHKENDTSRANTSADFDDFFNDDGYDEALCNVDFDF